MKKTDSYKPEKMANAMVLGARQSGQSDKSSITKKKNTLSSKGAVTDSVPMTASIDIGPSISRELPNAAMPGLIGDIVRLICAHSEVDPIYAVVTLLAWFGAMVENPFFKYRRIKQHCRTNAVFAGLTAKSLNATFNSSVASFFKGIPDKCKSVCGHMQTGKGLIDIINSETKTSNNGFSSHARSDTDASDTRLLFREIEFQSALAHAKKPGNTLLQVIKDLSDFGRAELPVKSGNISAKNAHVSILARTGCIDFSMLYKEVKRADMFSSYFLWFIVDRPKLVSNPKRLRAKDVEPLQYEVARRVLAARKRQQIKMSKLAREHWDIIYLSLANDVPGVVGTVLSRTEIHTIRLALTYAMFAGHEVIKLEDLVAAHALVQFSRESASIIFGGSQGDNYKEKILCALHADPDHELSRTEISGELGRNAASADISSALKELKKLNLVESEKQESKTGRKKTIVRLVSR